MKILDPSQYSLGDRVYEELRKGIVSQELKPGELYSVAALAERLGVSRTPVREALLQFATNGVVRFERNRGVRVLEVSIKDIEEIYSIRLLLEPPAAFLAAQKIDEAGEEKLTAAYDMMRKAAADGDEETFQKHDIIFHVGILEIAGNDRVTEAVRVARSQMHARGLSTTSSRNLDEILSAHEPIMTAILGRDPAAAAMAVKDHLTGTLELLAKQSMNEGATIPYRQPYEDWIKFTYEEHG